MVCMVKPTVIKSCKKLQKDVQSCKKMQTLAKDAKSCKRIQKTL